MWQARQGRGLWRPGISTWLVLFLVVVVTGSTLTGCPGPARRPGTDREPVISLYINETGETKRIGLEEYVKGVVAAEMDTNWPLNALAAQAIMARTFTMKKIQEGGVKARGTDASTSVEEFQAYNPEKITDNVSRAVLSSRGEVVTYDGNYINAWFHADGGGRTAASAVEGLDYRQEKTPYIQSVKDPGAAITPQENRSWQAFFPTDVVRSAVGKVAGRDPGGISSAAITEKGPSGRATRIRVGSVEVSAPALRLALGNDKMRSTLLNRLQVQDGGLVMNGSGYGHGVGMSQWGARVLAGQGRSPQEIIRYFFREVRVEDRW